MFQPLKILDLFSGLGGATSAFISAGHSVIRIDINRFKCSTIQADCRFLPLKKSYFDLIWASPPCTEFSKTLMPWFPTQPTPSLELVCAALSIINEFQPKFWVIENVKGSIPFISQILGQPKFISLPYVLWGYFPTLSGLHFSRSMRIKIRTSGSIYRSVVHPKLSKALCSSIEQYLF